MLRTSDFPLSRLKSITFILYLLSLLSLLIYSYSQIDLNLTLSSNPIYQSFQQQLIHLGYFNRPLSTAVFLTILFLLLTSYFLLLCLVQQGKLSTQEIIRLTILTIGILLFSYPAFSHDIFNYIFDARILVHHRANPYTHTALDFPSDLWTRFMRWTHRTYPYGPTWLPLSSLFYLLGLGKFTPTLLSFKLLGALSYLLSVFSLHNLASNIHKNKKNSNLKPLTLTLFAFNPLIIIESLVSPHLDITMAAFMLFSLYLIVSKKKLASWFSFVISIGIKYVSIAAAPLILLIQADKKHPIIRRTPYAILLSYIVTLFIISQREILPWYFITPFALSALTPKHKFFTTLMLALTIGTLLRYALFLYIGDYTPWVKQSRELITFSVLLIIFAISYLLTHFRLPLITKAS